jgi:hypothetical protein
MQPEKHVYDGASSISFPEIAESKWCKSSIRQPLIERVKRNDILNTVSMDRRDFLRTVAAQATAGELLKAAPANRPNFLFLIADDLTFRGMRAMGNSEIETPNLDRLSRRGCTFTHCFHQGSWSPAVCIASRTMLNTGLTAFRAQKLVEETPLWGETLGNAGYDTFLVGKWHLSKATLARSFKKTGPVSPGMFESGPQAYNRPSPGNTWSPWDTSLKGQWLHTSEWEKAADDSIRHSAAIWADGAVEYLEKQTAQASSPFFLTSGLTLRTIHARPLATLSSAIQRGGSKSPRIICRSTPSTREIIASAMSCWLRFPGPARLYNCIAPSTTPTPPTWTRRSAASWRPSKRPARRTILT